MKRAAPILCLLSACAAAFADPRVAMREGFEAFERGEFVEAAAAFGRAEQEAASSNLDPTVPRFNKGVALYRQQLWDAAASTFMEARLTPDLDRQARALYNAGCCRLRQVDAAIEAGDGRLIEQHLDEAIEWLGQSLLIRPDRADARIQLERALATRETFTLYLSELSALAQQADRLIGEHRFEEAHAALTVARERLGPALILPRPEVKSFEQTLERTGQIVQILKTEEHPALAP
jgi:tetratricopeptide (TPR) repeat protein